MNNAVIAGLIAQAKRSPVRSGKKYKIKKANARNGTTMTNATFVVGRMRSSRARSLEARFVLLVIFRLLDGARVRRPLLRGLLRSSMHHERGEFNLR